MLNITCISNFGFFDSPEFLKLSLHLSAATSTPIYLLGVNCILYKTPKVIESVKWYLFALHIWITAFDYSLSLLLTPMVFFPQLAWIPYGVLRLLGVPPVVQYGILLLTTSYMMISTFSIYENRFFIVCDFRWKDKWEVLRPWYLFLHYLVGSLWILPEFFMVPEQETARILVFQNLPCLPVSLYQEEVFVPAIDLSYHLLLITILTSIVGLEVDFFVVCLLWNAKQQLKSKRMSPTTYQLQKKFLFALVLQTVIPAVMLSIPFTGMQVVFQYGSGVRSQALLNLGTLVIKTHGPISTVIMILVHRPYRVAVGEMIMGRGSSRTVPVSKTLKFSVVSMS